jgi:EVE domain
MMGEATRYWIGVASKDHVMRGVEGGFCQLGHGKRTALERMNPGDWIAYYSPRTTLEGGETVQAFTALGQISEGEVYIGDMGPNFKPYRRDVRFLEVVDAPIRPLIDQLSFILDPKRWGYPFHRGHLEMTRTDFERIALAMGSDSSSTPD